MRRTGVLSATLLVVALAATPAFATNRPPGPPLKVTVRPTAAVAGSTDNAFTFKVKAASRARGQLRIVVPAGWSAPQASNAKLPGYVAIHRSTCASAGLLPASITGSGPWTMLIAFKCGQAREVLHHLRRRRVERGDRTRDGDVVRVHDRRQHPRGISVPADLPAAGGDGDSRSRRAESGNPPRRDRAR